MTVTGRCIAVALMIAGIALLGTVTATLASWIVRRVAEEDESSQAATRRQVEELTAQVNTLKSRAAVTPPRRHHRSAPRMAPGKGIRHTRTVRGS